MNPLTGAHLAWSVYRSARASKPDLERLRDSRLRRLIRHAYSNVPYYRRLFTQAGVDPRSIRTAADLSQVPITTKRDLQLAGPDAVSGIHQRSALITRRTSGSAGEPATLYFDRRFEYVRKLLFIRALMAAGYRPGSRILMMKPDVPDRESEFPGRLEVRFDESPESVVNRIRDEKPSILYGWVTPLLAICEYMKRSGYRISGLRAIVTTAESLITTARCDIENTFGAPVFDIYGLTEMGTVAWECQYHDGYHVSEDIVLVEYEPIPSLSGECALVMTNLELTAMPMIRYRTGDLAQLAETGICSCGRTLRRIRGLSGRSVDCLNLPNGKIVSPYAVTLALEPLPGLLRYQVIQESFTCCLVRCEKASGASFTEEVVRNALAHLLGDMQINVRFEDRIRASRGRKFRVVESRVVPENES